MTLRINPDGIAATVTWFDDGFDSRELAYTVYLKFDDDKLNPPDDSDDPFNNGWEAGRFRQDWRLPGEAKALEIAQPFYDFLMAYNASGDFAVQIKFLEDRLKTLDELMRLREIAYRDLQTRFEAANARIGELETDYVKRLEADNKWMRGVLLKITDTARDGLRPVKKTKKHTKKGTANGITK